MRRARGAALVLVRIAVSVVVVLLVMELAIDRFGAFIPAAYRTGPLIEVDQDLGWRHIPSSITWYRGLEFTSAIEINAQGRVGPLLRDPRTGPRILLLGDSFVEAREVPYPQSIAGRLGTLLEDRQAEIVNDGVSGYGTDQELLVLERELPALRPDAIVLMFAVTNDVWDNYPAFTSLRPTKTKPHFELGPGDQPVLVPADPIDPTERVRGLLARSTALTVLKSGIADHLFDRNAGPVRHQQLEVLVAPHDDWLSAWHVTEALLRRMVERASSAAIPLVLVITPDGCQVQRPICGDRPDLVTSDVPQARLRAFAQTIGLAVVDPLDALRASAAAGQKVYFVDEWHLNARGHEILADMTANALRGMVR